MCALLVVAAMLHVAAASPRDWSGSAACGSCHPAELAAWKATPHAATRARFAGAPEGRCLACHGTGEAPAGPTVAIEVGCEACHGAGAAYASDDVMRDRPVALALGLADLSTPKLRAALCMQCHARPTRGAPFDPAAPVHAISTPRRPSAALRGPAKPDLAIGRAP
ncbi:MAG TPA: multiheme c-type cytochrome [Kofleriaceae bacterium]|nr:multiheme c-type cytochrome [Kofleriaceae bacterium]